MAFSGTRPNERTALPKASRDVEKCLGTEPAPTIFITEDHIWIDWQIAIWRVIKPLSVTLS